MPPSITFFNDGLCVSDRVDSNIAKPSGKTQSVRPFSQESRLKEGIQESDPIPGPVEGSSVSTVAGLEDSSEVVPVFISSEQKFLIDIWSIQLDSLAGQIRRVIIDLIVEEWWLLLQDRYSSSSS